MAAAVAMLAAACGGSADSPGARAGDGAAAHGWRAAVRGPAISVTAAGAVLPALRDGFALRPVAALGREVLINVAPEAAGPGPAPEQFALWDPESGAVSPAWVGEPGKQEIVTGADGDFVVSVRTGFELPFADWEILLRRPAAGEVKVVAHSDASVANAPGVEPVLPLGLAPSPSLAGGHVAWVAYEMGNDGRAHRRIRLLDAATGQASMVADVVAGTGQTLDSPSVGGGRLAWIAGDRERQQIVVRDLATGVDQLVHAEGRPFMAALSGDGRFLAWDDRMTAKYAQDLESGDVVRYATDEGWGVIAAGGRFAWAPAAAYGGRGGYYDAAAGVVRLLAAPASKANFAQVIGPWFAWQDRTADGVAVYRFMSTGGE